MSPKIFCARDNRDHIVTIAKLTAEQAVTKKAAEFVKAPPEPAAALQ